MQRLKPKHFKQTDPRFHADRDLLRLACRLSLLNITVSQLSKAVNGVLSIAYRVRNLAVNTS
jgi:hypothetical protein